MPNRWSRHRSDNAGCGCPQRLLPMAMLRVNPRRMQSRRRRWTGSVGDGRPQRLLSTATPSTRRQRLRCRHSQRTLTAGCNSMRQLCQIAPHSIRRQRLQSLRHSMGLVSSWTPGLLSWIRCQSAASLNEQSVRVLQQRVWDRRQWRSLHRSRERGGLQRTRRGRQRGRGLPRSKRQ